MLALEAVVEPLGDPLDVEGLARLRRVTSVSVRALFFVERERDRVELLDQRVAGWSRVESVLAAGGWLARLAPDPLPDLGGLGCVGDR